MGDGSVEAYDNTGRMTLEMINKDFLEWVDSKLGSLSTGVKLKFSAETKAKLAEEDPHIQTLNPENYSDIYKLRTRRHPYFRKLREWYSSGCKRFPDDLELTPLITKMWFVCDGSLTKSTHNKYTATEQAYFYTSNESDRIEDIADYFRDLGLTPFCHPECIRFRKSDTRWLLDWMGSSPDGFEYKFTLENEASTRCNG